MIDSKKFKKSYFTQSIWLTFIFICLIFLASIFVAPTIGVILSSLKTKREIAFGLLWTFPTKLYLENYLIKK